MQSIDLAIDWLRLELDDYTKKYIFRTFCCCKTACTGENGKWCHMCQKPVKRVSG